MKQVTLVGGGLAGLSLGIALRHRQVPVRLLEAGTYPRHRVCGEFISGVSRETLETLGVAEALADAGRHTQLAWHRMGRKMTQADLPEPALAISRFRLDQRLSQRFESLGGALEQRCRAPLERQEGWVWTAGRARHKGNWLGLKCHVRELKLDAPLEMHVGRNGYVGLTEIEDQCVNVCGLFRLDRTIKGQRSDLLLEYLKEGGLRDLAARIQAADIDEVSFLGVTGFEFGWQSQDERECRVGEAAAMIPPFTGNGMSMAFEAAELALNPLAAWSRGELEWPELTQQIAHDARRHFSRRMRHALRLQKVLMHSGGQSLLESLSRLGLLPFRPMLSLVR